MKYIFRGLVVFEYDPETKDMEADTKYIEWGQEEDDGVPNFNKCQFIPEDYAIMAGFFNKAHAHATGAEDVDLTDIVVD